MTYRDLVEQRSKNWWNDSYNQKKHIHSKIHCNRYWSLEDLKEPVLLYCCPLWQRKFNHRVNSRTLAQLCQIPMFPLYWLGTDLNQIPWKSLYTDSRKFIIRPSYGHDQYNVYGPEEELLKKLRKYQNKYAPRTVHFLVEPQSHKTSKCIRYDVHMFGDKIGLIQRYTGCPNGNATKGGRNKKFFQQKHMLYDENWQPLPLCERQNKSYLMCFPLDSVSLPPPYLSTMLKYATQLGKIYDGYVKLSFRELEKDIYFYDMDSLHCRCSYYGRRKTCLSITCNAYFTSLWILATSPAVSPERQIHSQQRYLTTPFRPSKQKKLHECSFLPPLPPGKLTRFSYYEYLILSSNENVPCSTTKSSESVFTEGTSFLTLITRVKESWNTKRYNQRRAVGVMARRLQHKSRFPKKVRQRYSPRYQGPIKIPSIRRPEENMMERMSHHFPKTV